MVYKDLKKAKFVLDNIKENPFYQFSDFERIYPFSNENLKGCFKYFNLNNKDCLTVLGSGDQTLDMCLLGAKSITSFDLNPLTNYYFCLKKAALLANISKDEYLKFFCYRHFFDDGSSNENVFNIKTFSKIAPFLSSDSYTFWTKLFDEYSIFQIRNVKSLFYFFDEEGFKVLEKTINYLEQDNYDKLKERIKDLKFNFIKSDLKYLKNKLNQNYDFIYLSNIIQYVNLLYQKRLNKNNISLFNRYVNSLIEYKKLVESFIPTLKENGQIMLGYFYVPLIFNNIHFREYKQIEEIFLKNDLNYYYVFFESMVLFYENILIKENYQDGCLVYQKKINNI